MIPIFYSEINVLCIVLLLLIFVKLRTGTALQIRKHLFRIVLLTNCFFFTLDIVWVFIDCNSLKIGIGLNWIINILYYITSGVVCYYWFLYSENVQRSRLVKDFRCRILCAVPVIILTILTLASVKYKWLFYIDDENAYHRGKYYFIQLIGTWGYILFTAAKAWIKSLRSSNYFKKKEYRTLGDYVIASFICGMIQLFVPGISLICAGTTFGCLYVFISMQDQMIFLDALTGLNNRNKLMQHLSDTISHSDDRKQLYLVMMDLDYFKSINDGYGHVEGDNALRIVADGLKMCCKDRHYFIARYGGDEFSAVCELDSEESIEEFRQNVRLAIKEKSQNCPYKLSISIGYKKYDPSIKTEQEFIKLADAELYKEKQSKKRIRVLM